MHRASNVDIRRRLRSADSGTMLMVPSTRRSALGGRAFPVASAILSFFFAFLYNFVRCSCNVFDVIVSP